MKLMSVILVLLCCLGVSAFGVTNVPAGMTFDEFYYGLLHPSGDDTCRTNLPPPIPWAETVRMSSRRYDVPMNVIVSNLMRFVEDGMKLQFDGKTRLPVSDKQDVITAYERCEGAIYLLGQLRTKEACPLLVRAANLPLIYDVYRHAAIPAVIQIGDTNMLDFAREVCTNREKFGNSFSYEILLRELGYYADPASGDSRRSAVIQFLLQYKDCSIWSIVQAMDESLCKADEEYGRSHEREAILEKIRGVGFYRPDELNALKALPAERRTHVDLNTLATKPPLVKPSTTSTPPVAPKTN